MTSSLRVISGRRQQSPLLFLEDDAAERGPLKVKANVKAKAEAVGVGQLNSDNFCQELALSESHEFLYIAEEKAPMAVAPSREEVGPPDVSVTFKICSYSFLV